MQRKQRLFDEIQFQIAIHALLNIEDLRLQLIACRLQGILQLTQCGGSLRQQGFTVVDRIAPIFIQQIRNLLFDRLLLLIHHTLVKVDAIEDFTHRIFEHAKHVFAPMSDTATLLRRFHGFRHLIRHHRELDG
ncbi:Uncharacterised protein [Vibrio cholerae]|nr:Uncharacterised protein [Vibrio cholerae]